MPISSRHELLYLCIQCRQIKPEYIVKVALSVSECVSPERWDRPVGREREGGCGVKFIYGAPTNAIVRCFLIVWGLVFGRRRICWWDGSGLVWLC